MTHLECLQKLWARVRNERIHVGYVRRSDTGEDGMYHPPDRIDICRDMVPEPKDELNDSSPVYDLCVLAHEYGHCLSGSWRNGEDPLSKAKFVLFHAPRRDLTDEERGLVLQDERDAWHRGREELANIGLEDFESYDRKTEATLEDYRRLFDELRRLHALK
jgi:hypothetical protein